ncbi:hypothetical protein HAX54_041253, partial [Datura stramonium]|nr:hypothetical protein [Datura stramonium]
ICEDLSGHFSAWGSGDFVRLEVKRGKNDAAGSEKEGEKRRGRRLTTATGCFSGEGGGSLEKRETEGSRVISGREMRFGVVGDENGEGNEGVSLVPSVVVFRPNMHGTKSGNAKGRGRNGVRGGRLIVGFGRGKGNVGRVVTTRWRWRVVGGVPMKYGGEEEERDPVVFFRLVVRRVLVGVCRKGRGRDEGERVRRVWLRERENEENELGFGGVYS